MLAVPKQLGEKFMYSKVDLETTVRSVKDVLSLLERARICSRVRSSAANGIPLAAEIKEKVFKEVFLDVGLCCAALGLAVAQLRPDDKTFLINQGGFAEQVVGQLLRTISPPYIEPSLYYWQRSEGSKSSEVDYVIQHGNQLIPIEVKAGSTGTLKSLHVLMGLRKLPLAVRINADLPTKTEIDFKVHLKKDEPERVRYTLLTIPFYLIGQIHRLIGS